MKNSGNLCVLGVGPGDPELLTLKARRRLEQVELVLAPVARPGGESQALETVRVYLKPGQRVETLHISMSPDLEERRQARRAAAGVVQQALAEGRRVALLVEGDPLLYSTYLNLGEYLPDETPVEIVPGISSLQAGATAAALPLVRGDERLGVLTAASLNGPLLHDLLRQFDTLAVLKVSLNWEKFLDLLAEAGCLSRALLVERAALPGQAVYHQLQARRDSRPHYMSLVFIRAKEEEGRHED